MTIVINADMLGKKMSLVKKTSYYFSKSSDMWFCKVDKINGQMSSVNFR